MFAEFPEKLTGCLTSQRVPDEFTKTDQKSEGERIFSFLKRDRHTEEENRTEKLSQQTKLLDCITTESTAQGAIHRCKTDFKNYENYLEKDIYRQNTEENLQ